MSIDALPSLISNKQKLIFHLKNFSRFSIHFRPLDGRFPQLTTTFFHPHIPILLWSAPYNPFTQHLRALQCDVRSHGHPHLHLSFQLHANEGFVFANSEFFFESWVGTSIYICCAVEEWSDNYYNSMSVTGTRGATIRDHHLENGLNRWGLEAIGVGEGFSGCIRRMRENESGWMRDFHFLISCGGGDFICFCVCYEYFKWISYILAFEEGKSLKLGPNIKGNWQLALQQHCNAFKIAVF